RHQRLPGDAGVVTPGVEGFAIGRLRRGKHGANRGAAGSCLPCGARCDKQRRTLAVVPKQTWTYVRPAVAGQIGPAVAVDVVLFVPVAPGEQRRAPTAL